MSNYFQFIPFGVSLPIDNPHAVSVSMPLLQNVIDYEEGNKETILQMESGYPRFFQNKFVRKLENYIRKENQISQDKVVLPIATLHAKSILEYLVQMQFEYIEEEGNIFLILENDTQFVKKCTDYIRNVGLLISSRKAENTLYKLGQIENIFQENKITNLPEKRIKNILSKAYSVALEDDILLTNCGMNALFSASETIVNIRKKENRTIVIQLGWLYVDTMEIIEKRNEKFHVQINVHDKLQLENWLEKNHLDVATLVTEVITNPLMHCVDLPWLFNLCKKYDIVLIVDVTMATPFNIDVMPYCDIAVESLTKFACGNGDLLMGAMVLNEKSEMVQVNKSKFQKFIVPAFDGEIQRLAFQIEQYEDRVKTVSQNSKAVYDYLKKQTIIKEIYSVNSLDSNENFLKIRKSKDAFPGVISIVFDKDLAYYYDKLNLAKGPSLGIEFTIAMPYVYLAHYDCLKTEEGKQKLLELGINPNLLRLSIGVEPVENIIKAFEKLSNNN